MLLLLGSKFTSRFYLSDISEYTSKDRYLDGNLVQTLSAKLLLLLVLLQLQTVVLHPHVSCKLERGGNCKKASHSCQMSTPAFLCLAKPLIYSCFSDQVEIMPL